MAILAYIFFVALLIRFFVVFYNYTTQPLLPYFNKSVSINEVSILIPARNEEFNISKLLQNLSKIDVLEIIVCDDHSTDNTKQVIENEAISNGRLKYLFAQPLPAEWLGKNWACHQLAQNAKGKYMLFLDADVEITSHLISNALQQMQDSKVQILSIFPDQKIETLGEKTIVPLMHYLLLTLLPLRLVKNSTRSSLAAANGQFMMFDSETYFKNSFHYLVRNNILDDVNIVRIAKQKMISCETLLANQQIFCRMYQSLEQGLNGFSKNLFLGFGKNIIAISLYFMCIIWGYIFIFASNNPLLIGFSLFFIIFQRICISKLSHQSWIVNMLLHPVQMFFYQLIAIQSVYKHIFGTIIWKNRHI